MAFPDVTATSDAAAGAAFQSAAAAAGIPNLASLGQLAQIQLAVANLMVSDPTTVSVPAGDVLSGTFGANKAGGADTGTYAFPGAFTFVSSGKSTTALATPSAIAATQFTAFASTLSGAVLMGFGTTFDVALKNRAGTDVIGITANTTGVVMAGALAIVGALSGVTSAVFSTLLSSVTALATPSALAATTYSAFASTVFGAAIMGFGTTNDVSLMNRAGTVVLGVGPNTTLVNIPGTLLVSGTTTIAADGGLLFTNGTDAAGANVGTLTNCPHTGNPAKWGRLSWNGTQYAVPLFALT